MASISRSRSGGKILRPRRTATANTPYHRSNPSPQSPNWLSRFVFSPTRSIATGAGKLFLSVLDLQSSPTSSSSSEEIDTSNDKNNTPFQSGDALKKSGTSAARKELQPLVGNSKSKHVIEKLLMQETFSREECDRLIKIIKSRVVDSPANEVDGDKGPSEMTKRTPGDIDTPDLCSAAVVEAKKWLNERKVGLGSMSDLGYGSHRLDLVTLPQALQDEGSPVDVAKSYMRAHPPWASPSIDRISPPTPVGIQLFKEETPYLISRNFTLSPKLKRNTGSWSIQDEIRRVRLRETEQMLKNLPSSKIDWSAFAVKCTNNVNSSAVENTEASTGEKVHNFPGSVDASSNLSGGLHTQTPLDLNREWNGLRPEAVLSDPANISFKQNAAFEAIQQTEGSQHDCRDVTTPGQKLKSSDGMVIMVQSDGDVVKVNGSDDTDGVNHHLNSVEETTEASDPRLHDGSCSVFKEKVGAEDAMANSSPSSGSCSHGEQVIEQNDKTSDNKESTVDSDHKRIEKDVPERETETFLELPDLNLSNIVAMDEDDGVASASASENSSSLQFEAEHHHSQPYSEPDLAAPTNSISDKQKVQRITRYRRRAKGRGVK